MTQDNAGVSAQREYQRRHDRRSAEIDENFGRLAPVVEFLFEDPESIRNWQKGSAGERKLAASLERRVGDRAVLLHDRRIPGRWANIDHLVVAPSGVWIVDTKTNLGEIVWRGKGRWLRVEHHLFVGGRDRTELVEKMAPQVDAVRVALGGLDVPLYASLCFVDAEWSVFTKPFVIADVWVTPPRRLAHMIGRPGPLSEDDVLTVARRLDEVLRPA